MIHPGIEPGGIYIGMIGRTRFVTAVDPITEDVDYHHAGQTTTLTCTMRTMKGWAIFDVTETYHRPCPLLVGKGVATAPEVKL